MVLPKVIGGDWIAVIIRCVVHYRCSIHSRRFYHHFYETYRL
jgi:hypothetical protein